MVRIYSYLPLFFLCTAIFLSFPFPIHAALSCGNLPSGGGQDPVCVALNNIFVVSKILASVVFMLALVVFAWGIVKLIAASGDPGAIKTAKGYIIWGVIGMAVLGSVIGLITFLQAYFGIKSGGGTISVPVISQSK